MSQHRACCCGGEVFETECPTNCTGGPCPSEYIIHIVGHQSAEPHPPIVDQTAPLTRYLTGCQWNGQMQPEGSLNPTHTLIFDVRCIFDDGSPVWPNTYPDLLRGRAYWFILCKVGTLGPVFGLARPIRRGEDCPSPGTYEFTRYGLGMVYYTPYLVGTYEILQ